MLLFICIVGIITLVVTLFFHHFMIGSVLGNSMYPTLADGELILVKRKYKLEVGKVYVARLEGEHIHIVKRLVKMTDEGIYLLGDNADYSYDSRNYGFVDPSTIIGEVLKLKFWRKL